MSLDGWEGRLHEASTREEVVSVAREFVARWSPAELAALPVESLPAKIVDDEDVSQYALRLMQRSCAGDRMDDGPLQHLASFFNHASSRLAQITGQPAEASSEES